MNPMMKMMNPPRNLLKIRQTSPNSMKTAPRVARVAVAVAEADGALVKRLLKPAAKEAKVRLSISMTLSREPATQPISFQHPPARTFLWPMLMNAMMRRMSPTNPQSGLMTINRQSVRGVVAAVAVVAPQTPTARTPRGSRSTRWLLSITATPIQTKTSNRIMTLNTLVMTKGTMKKKSP